MDGLKKLRESLDALGASDKLKEFITGAAAVIMPDESLMMRMIELKKRYLDDLIAGKTTTVLPVLTYAAHEEGGHRVTGGLFPSGSDHQEVVDDIAARTVQQNECVVCAALCSNIENITGGMLKDKYIVITYLGIDQSKYTCARRFKLDEEGHIQFDGEWVSGEHDEMPMLTYFFDRIAAHAVPKIAESIARERLKRILESN